MFRHFGSRESIFSRTVVGKVVRFLSKAAYQFYFIVVRTSFNNGNWHNFVTAQASISDEKLNAAAAAIGRRHHLAELRKQPNGSAIRQLLTAAMAAGGVGVASMLFGRELADDHAFLAAQLARGASKGPYARCDYRAKRS